MRRGHSPSKAVSIADALARKAVSTTTPANVDTVDPAAGTAGADGSYFVNPTAAAHGAVTCAEHGCEATHSGMSHAEHMKGRKSGIREK